MSRSTELWSGLILIVAALLAAVGFIIVAIDRPLTQLEQVLLQLLPLALGLVGSFLFGRHSSKTAAREMIKVYIRPAFRRLVTLYEGLSRLHNMIKSEQQSSKGSEDAGDSGLSKIEVAVIDQIATADDALADWRDISPEDVEEFQGRLRDLKKMRDTHDK